MPNSNDVVDYAILSAFFVGFIAVIYALWPRPTMEIAGADGTNKKKLKAGAKVFLRSHLAGMDPTIHLREIQRLDAWILDILGDELAIVRVKLQDREGKDVFRDYAASNRIISHENPNPEMFESVVSA